MASTIYRRGNDRVNAINADLLATGGMNGGAVTSSGTIERAETVSPVGVLSTDNAKAVLDKKKSTLDQIAPPAASSDVATKKDVTEAAKPAPKAYFMNEQGQEAEFTDEQLKTPDTQKFLKDRGYMQTRTEGPNYDVMGGAKTEIASYDKTLEDLATKFLNYNVDTDPAFLSYASSIKSQYDQLRQNASQNAQTQAEIQSKVFGAVGSRTGLSRYNPNGFAKLRADAVTATLQSADDKLAEFTSKEAEAIASARKSYQDGKYSAFNDQMNVLDKIRDNKAKALEDYHTALSDVNKDLREQNKKAKETIRQASRDTAVSSIVAQGITDPKQILNYLNYDEGGNQRGDFTAAELAKTLKAIAPADDLAKLSGSVRDFYLLQKQGKLPASVTNLPEDQQLFGWLKQQKEATRVAASSKTDPITLSEAHTLGLPISVVGMSQEDILDSLYDDKPPAWFMEKLVDEQGNDDYADTRWDEYRNEHLTSFEEGDAGGP